jgi:hypothetical protein
MHPGVFRLFLIVVGFGCTLALPGAGAARAVSAPVAVALMPEQDVSFPFWCDWAYDWEERCYRDDSDRLPIGGDDVKVWRAGLRFPVASIPRGAEILEASLRVHHDGTCLAPLKRSQLCQARSYALDVHAILSPVWFHEREVDIGPALGRAYLASAARADWLTWDLSDLVAAWVAGEANDGVLLKLAEAEEDYGVSGPKVPSSRFASPGVRPVLDVTYLPPRTG